MEIWKEELEQLVENRWGVSLDDLPDFAFADWFKAGVGVETAFFIIEEEIKLMVY